jgi:hypothetical protein
MPPTQWSLWQSVSNEHALPFAIGGTHAWEGLQ